MMLNRRDFGKLALAAAATPASSLLAAKPNSVYGGVQIGVISYSFRDMPDAHIDAEKMLKYIIEAGASGVELMADAAEAWVGMPKELLPGAGRGGAAGASGRGASGASGATALDPAAQAEARAAAQKAAAARAETLKNWRLSVSMDKYRALRKLYNDAGVSIYCFKLEPQPAMSQEELDYIFGAAAALGATHVTRELYVNARTLTMDMAFTQRLADTALKHGIRAAYHTHEEATFKAWDAVLAQSKGNAVNMDCGHYFAGTGESPVPLIEKLHDRIASIHLKDRGKGGVPAPNLPWGQADTPIIEILQLMKKNKYTFPASVELEYQIPQGSDSVVEVKKCIEYARKALA